MSKYYSAADPGCLGDDPRLDLTDLYVFAAPLDRRQTVLIIDVNPAWNGMSRVPPFLVTSGFHPDAVYRINVDNDGDVAADVAFSFVFSDLSDGGQTGTAYYATGNQARRPEPSGEVLVRSTPVGFGADAVPVPADDCQLFIGVRSDPSFADGAVHELGWAGQDTFAKRNVLSIALQVPDDRLLAAGSDFAAWATVSLRSHGRLVQVNRAGHPVINPFMSSDVLVFDTNRPATYPNGRLLTDDVLSARMAFLTDGTATSRPIGPRDDLLAEFPFLGPPNLLPA